jgi:hypothetical protein
VDTDAQTLASEALIEDVVEEQVVVTFDTPGFKARRPRAFRVHVTHSFRNLLHSAAR